MSRNLKRVILGFDAVRALLFRDHARQADFVAELEIASSYGYVPLYPAMTLGALESGLADAEKHRLRYRLQKVMYELSKGSLIGIPSNEEWLSSFQLLEESPISKYVEFADLVGLSMATQCGAAILTEDEHFLSYIARYAPEVPVPPFRQTLKETIGEAEPM